MDNVPSSAMIAVFSLIVAAVLVTALIMSINYTGNLGRSSTTVSQQMQTQTDQDDLLQYDGSTLSGADVRNLIKKKEQQQLFIEVVQPGSNCFYNSASLAGAGKTDSSAASAFGNAAYINPLDQYAITLHRNAKTDAIDGIICTKK